MRTAWSILLVVAFARADEPENPVPVPVPDSDLAVLLNQSHPKHADTLARYDGKLVRLSGTVRWGVPNQLAGGGKGFGLLAPAFKVKDRPVAVKLALPDTPAGDALRARIKDAKPPGLKLTVVGRVRLGRATDGEGRESKFFAGLADVTEAK